MLACIEKSNNQSIKEICDNNFIQIGEMSYLNSFVRCISTKRLYKPKRKAADIEADEEGFDEDHLFYKANVVITGKLSHFTRAEALQKIADIGGIPQDSVTKTTNFLIIGQTDFRVVGEEGISSKQKKAMKNKENGQEIEILSEDDFMELI